MRAGPFYVEPMARSELNYLQPTQLAQFVHSMASVTDEELAAKFISDAERMVDAYMGPAPKFYGRLTLDLTANLTSGNTALSTSTVGERRPNYWAKGGVYVRVTDGPAAAIGEERLVVGSDDEQLTLVSGFSVDLPSASAKLELYQRSVFPRFWDVDAQGDPFLPDVLPRAVAWQVEYGVHYGSAEFGLGDSGITAEPGGVQSRSYGGGYSETRDTSQSSGLAVWLAPKTRAVLRRLLNSTGRLRG